jgi:hypothetical protein
MAAAVYPVPARQRREPAIGTLVRRRKRDQPGSCDPHRPAVRRWPGNGQTDPRPTRLSDHAAVDVDDELECLPAAGKERDFSMRMFPSRCTHRVGGQ